MKIETKKERVRRTPEQIVADLEQEIASVKARAAAKYAKATPEGQALILAVRAIERAGRVANEAENGELVKALEAARAALAPAIVGAGYPDPGEGEARAAAQGGAGGVAMMVLN